MADDELETLRAENAELRSKLAAISGALRSLENIVINLQTAFGSKNVLTRGAGRLFTQNEVNALLKREREHATARSTAWKG